MPTLPPRPKIVAGPSRHVYDVIVAGGQLGGAIAGALLAKRGYRVLLVEHDGMGHGYEHGGYSLPYAPFVAPPLKAMAAFEDVLVELGLNTTLQRALKPHSPDVQLILPGGRIDIHHDEARRRAELLRELGESASATLDASLRALAAQHEQSDPFFKEELTLPPEGFFEALAFKRLVAKHPALGEGPALVGSDPASKLLAGLLPFLHYVDSADEPLAQTRPLSQALMAPNRYPGGREGLRDLFTRKLVDLGGDLLSRDSSEAAVIEELSFEGGKLVGVKVLQSENIYRASCMIAATDAGALRRLIVDKKKQRGLTDALDLVTTKRFLFSINWVLPTDAVPCGMGDLLLLDTQGALGPMLIQVHALPQKGDRAPEKIICAGAFIPSSARDLGEAHLKAVAVEMGSHLERLMPFSRERVALESAPYLDAGGVRGSRLLPHPLYSIDTERFLGITGLPQRTAVKNLFLASREVLPGLGLEGEVLAGVRSARLVQETMKKNDPLKR